MINSVGRKNENIKTNFLFVLIFLKNLSQFINKHNNFSSTTNL